MLYMTVSSETFSMHYVTADKSKSNNHVHLLSIKDFSDNLVYICSSMSHLEGT